MDFIKEEIQSLLFYFIFFTKNNLLKQLHIIYYSQYKKNRDKKGLQIKW